MSLPRYPEYKPSGVEWLGEVPAHWDVAALKTRYSVVGGSTPKSDEDAYWDGNIDWVTPADLSRLKGFEIGETLRRITAEGLNSCGTSLVPAGSIVLSTRAPIGSIGIAQTQLCTNQGCKSLVPVDGQNSRFATYALSHAKQELNIRGKGTTFLELSGDELRCFPMLFPNPAEQTAIATFLDRETAKIDALVAEQEQLIALLKEKRQAVISHAVTKGLNPNAPMKPSGIEWLAEVPAHWDVARLKSVALIQTGVAKGKDYRNIATVTVPYLRVANVQDGYLDLSEVAEIEVPVDDVPRYELKTGDVLMNEGGDFDKLGRGAIWHGEVAGCIHQNHVFVVRPHGVRSEWLNAVTSSDYAQFYFMGRSKQSTNLASISSSNLMELPVALPPDAEQEMILERIGDESKRIDALIGEVARGTVLLRERRSALISAAVIGQINVRSAIE